MCGEVWPGHRSPVHGALTDAGAAAAMWVRGDPRHMVRRNRGPSPFRADHSSLWTRPEMRPMVFGRPDLANAARPRTHPEAGAPHRF